MIYTITQSFVLSDYLVYIYICIYMKWQPTPVFLPKESHGQRSLVGYSPQSHKESDTTEWLYLLTYLVKAMVFPVVMYGCESWTVKKAEHRTIDAFELWCWRRLLGVWLEICKEIQPVLSEGDQPWDFFGRNDAKAEAPVLWPPHEKSWLIGKDSDTGRDWGQEEKGMTEDEIAGWHHWLDGSESEWTLGVGDGQGGLACCDSWGRKELDTTEWLKWTELNLDIHCNHIWSLATK